MGKNSFENKTYVLQPSKENGFIINCGLKNGKEVVPAGFIVLLCFFPLFSNHVPHQHVCAQLGEDRGYSLLLNNKKRKSTDVRWGHCFLFLLPTFHCLHESVGAWCIK